MGQKYTVVELNKHPQGSQVQDALSEMTGARTVNNNNLISNHPIIWKWILLSIFNEINDSLLQVPRVFVDGQCIGGGSDTVKMYKTGTLEKILSDESLPDEKVES
jgi:glutaredoxin